MGPAETRLEEQMRKQEQSPPFPGAWQHTEWQKPPRRGAQLLALTVEPLSLQAPRHAHCLGAGQAVGQGAFWGTRGHSLATEHPGRTREEEARGLH